MPAHLSVPRKSKHYMPPVPPSRIHETRNVVLHQGDALSLYQTWPSPVVIVSDGGYGVGGFPGDPMGPEGLRDWYQPHIEAWSKHATPLTTLWFWNTEVGWANIHPLLVASGWDYIGCNIWNKGIAHVAGNVNSKTIRRFPVVTELCAQYVRRARFTVSGREVQMKEWLRFEWQRSGLPLSATNAACGVKNAATRKYFTQCHLWYFPPPEAFEKLVAYANSFGNPTGRPYFSMDGVRSLTGAEWERMRSKFHLLEMGVTNVWDAPAIRGDERIKADDGVIHLNQKPVALIERIITSSSEPGDVVWEPFGGLCTAAVVSAKTGRACRSAEIIPDYYSVAVQRLSDSKTRLVEVK
jgi:hypothetical protein